MFPAGRLPSRPVLLITTHSVELAASPWKPAELKLGCLHHNQPHMLLAVQVREYDLVNRVPAEPELCTLFMAVLVILNLDLQVRVK